MSDAFSSSGDGEVFSLPQIRHLLRVEFARAQRYEYPLALVLLDFGPLRRALGEADFEARAPSLTTRLRELVRTSDYLGRTEADRVLVLLPHTDATGAERLVARARATFGPQHGDGASPVAGVASFEQGTVLFFDALLEAAEEALDQAHAEGSAPTRVL